MNIHHLELFYYVARHGGISEAVRHMPYGIQQPALSSQLIALEEDLGVALFQRRPFRLLPPGEELYAFARPFFDQLEDIEKKLRSGGRHQHLRVGASEVILRDHLPGPLRQLKRRFPELKVTLRTGYQPVLEGWLLRGELDFAVTQLDRKPPAGLSGVPLLELPLALLVPHASPLRTAAELLRRDRIDEPLIALPAAEPFVRAFHDTLAARGVHWFTGIEVSSLDIVHAYVANGYGLGLSVLLPRPAPCAEVRALPLAGFPRLTLGALWAGKPTAVTRALLNELQAEAKQLKA